MKHVQVELAFHGKGYIGLPYWAERAALIDIGKEVHPKLGDNKKAQAVLAACEKRGITPEQYAQLQERAARPFYTADETRTGEIVIPERVIQSFLNNASMECPKAVPKISAKGLTFIGVTIHEGFLRTGRHEADAKSFDRFVKMEESNQRTFSSSLYITEFNATGVLHVDEEVIKVTDLEKLMTWGGKWVGVGSARPQGYGRFVVSVWDVIGAEVMRKHGHGVETLV